MSEQWQRRQQQTGGVQRLSGNGDSDIRNLELQLPKIFN